MQLVEIALTGVRGLPEVRLSPKKGVNVLRMPHAEQRKQLVDALFFTLQVDAGSGNHLVDPGAKQSRSALTIQAKDGQLYRLFRDFSSGSARLQKKKGDSDKDWENLSADSAEISQFMRVQLRVPEHGTYERLFVLSPGRLVSKGPSVESRGGGPLWPIMDLLGGPGGGSSPGFPGALAGGTNPGFGTSPGFPGAAGFGTSPGMPPGALGGGPPMMRMQSALGPSPFGAGGMASAHDYAAMGLPPSPSFTGIFNPMNALAQIAAEANQPKVFDVDGARKEYARLKKQVALLKGAQGARGELDRLSRRRDELKGRVAELRETFKALEGAREHVAQYAHLAQVPPGTADRIKDLEGSAQRRDKELTRAREEREDLERQIAGASPRPLQNDPMFAGGLGVVALSIALAIGFSKPGLLLLNTGGAASAAAAALAYVAQLERQSRLALRVTAVDEREQRAHRQYDLETGVVRKLLAQLEIGEPAELLAQLEAAAQASREHTATAERVAAIQADPARRAELEELGKLEQRIDHLEGQLSTVDQSADGMALHELESKLQKVARELREHGDVVNEGEPGAGGGLGAAPGDDDEDRSLSAPGDSSEGLYAPGADEPEARFAVGAGGGWGGSKVRGDEGSEVPGDGTSALGAALSEVVHRPQAAICQALLPRLSQYLKAMTQGAFTGAEVGPRGEIRVKPSGAQASSPLNAVEPAALRAVEAAIHLAWLEAAVSRCQAPILVDDPWVGVSPSARKLIAQSFGYMADKAQLLVITPEGDIPGNALG